MPGRVEGVALPRVLVVDAVGLLLAGSGCSLQGCRYPQWAKSSRSSDAFELVFRSTLSGKRLRFAVHSYFQNELLPANKSCVGITILILATFARITPAIPQVVIPQARGPSSKVGQTVAAVSMTRMNLAARQGAFRTRVGPLQSDHYEQAPL